MPRLIVIQLHPVRHASEADFTNCVACPTVTAFRMSKVAPQNGDKIDATKYSASPDDARPWIPDASYLEIPSSQPKSVNREKRFRARKSIRT